MYMWFINNIGTIAVSLILALIVFFIISGMVKNKKNGKSSCGCSCEGCAMKGSCHKSDK